MYDFFNLTTPFDRDFCIELPQRYVVVESFQIDLDRQLFWRLSESYHMFWQRIQAYPLLC